MHVAVFGATDKVGKLVVVKLVEQGHSVSAFEDSINPFADHPNIKVVLGDVNNQDDVDRAVQGADAVITTMGTWKGAGGFAQAMNYVINCMEQHGIWRIISLTDVHVQIDGDSPGIVNQWRRKLATFLEPQTIRDREDQIRFLQASKLDWTVLRSPRIRASGKGSWRYAADQPSPLESVHASDVADALVAQMTDDRHVNQAPFLRKK